MGSNVVLNTIIVIVLDCHTLNKLSQVNLFLLFLLTIVLILVLLVFKLTDIFISNTLFVIITILLLFVVLVFLLVFLLVLFLLLVFKLTTTSGGGIIIEHIIVLVFSGCSIITICISISSTIIILTIVIGTVTILEIIFIVGPFISFDTLFAESAVLLIFLFLELKHGLKVFLHAHDVLSVVLFASVGAAVTAVVGRTQPEYNKTFGGQNCVTFGLSHLITESLDGRTTVVFEGVTGNVKSVHVLFSFF
mmetsp:Transcript_28113/g.39533  ORF Transcript_28113/g.39533 Transcript_28113/m.39533 type:complete len:249 (+) Transcript_28113:745-1491(+)